MSRVGFLLQQDEVWIDAAGRRLVLAAMDPHHRANLIPFLRRSAVTVAVDAGLIDPTPTEAEEWLAATPLMRKLVELDAGRPIEDRRSTHERNQAHEAATGYQKKQLVHTPGILHHDLLDDEDDAFDDGDLY